MPRPGSLLPHRMERLERLRVVEKYMRRGYSSQQEISNATGIPRRLVGKYIAYIYKRWQTELPAEYQAKIIARINQLQEVMIEMRLAFEKSKRGEETQSWITRPCSACAGAEDVTDHPDPPCKECGGTGKVTTMHSAIKDSKGDPAYMVVVKDCIKECARLETLLLNGGQARPQKVIHEGAVGLIGLQVPPHLVGVATEQLLKARAVLQELISVDAAGGAIEGSFVRREGEKEAG